MPPAKKALPQLDITAAPLGAEQTEAANVADITAAPLALDAVAPAPSPVEVAYHALVAIGYGEEVARDIVLGKGLPPVDQPAQAPTARETDAPICPRGCFRRGWAGVGPGIDSVSCEHGSWDR
jgi:hypothetical protein